MHWRPVKAARRLAAGAAVLAATAAVPAARHALDTTPPRAVPMAHQAAVAGWAAPVGALFSAAPGGRRAGAHFCTASVVDSPAGDLVMTAAHCVQGRTAGRFVFVPGYRNGQSPYGAWLVIRVIVDHDWSSSADPDDDVAFLIVAQRGGATRLQGLTGGEQLGIGRTAGQLVEVIGYPDRAQAPISCLNRARRFSATQLEFDCGGYAAGTSGSPLLSGVSQLTGLGTVIGVIGGYQQGGDTASVSYAARLGANVAALYKAAIAQP